MRITEHTEVGRRVIAWMERQGIEPMMVKGTTIAMDAGDVPRLLIEFYAPVDEILLGLPDESAP